MDSALSFATRLARQAGELLTDAFNPAGTHTRLKPDRTVVTEADLAADRLIAEAVRLRSPTDAIISEELHPVLGEAADTAWVVDPLDGTTNFSLGLSIWGVSIAQLVDGWPAAAAIFFPVLDELYTAGLGQGASLNGAPIEVKPPITGQPTAFFSCCSRTHRRYEVNVRYKTRILGSAAYTFCAVARGMAVLGFEASPKLWDLSAGWLIVSEAGGQVESLDTSPPFPLIPGFDYRTRDYPTIMAASSELVEYARQNIRRKEPQKQ